MQGQTKKYDLEAFTENFFKSLGCELTKRKGILYVNDVPTKFESFVGKKGPYKLVFSSENLVEGTELIAPGKFFLNAMSRFISSRSKKTLLRLKNNLDPVEIINDRFTFYNAEVKDVKTHADYEVIYRFTFSTSFQYRNGKKQETHHIYLKNGKVVKINFSEHGFEETKKKIADISDLEKEYEKAKEELKGLVSKKTDSIGKDLKLLLDNEIRRVKEHYLQQLEDIEQEISGLEKQIVDLQRRMEKAVGEEKDRLKKRLDLAEKNLVELLKENKAEKLVKERDFVIEDEKFKHGLNVMNKLINTSIIFVPQYTFDVLLKTGYGEARVKVFYDSLQKYSPPLVSESGGVKTYKAYICAAGKVCLKGELVRCVEDDKLYSKSEMFTVCEHYKKPVYHKNAVQCSVSGKWYSKSYIRIDAVSGKPVYVNLLKRCPASGLYTAEKNFVACPGCGARVVPSALKTRFSGQGVERHCGLCK